MIAQIIVRNDTRMIRVRRCYRPSHITFWTKRFTESFPHCTQEIRYQDFVDGKPLKGTNKNKGDRLVLEWWGARSGSEAQKLAYEYLKKPYHLNLTKTEILTIYNSKYAQQ